VQAGRPTLRRLASFASSPPLDRPSSTVSCVRLANRGFLYAGHADQLVCQRCGAEVAGWLDADRDPVVEHRCPSAPSSTAAAAADDDDDLRLIVRACAELRRHCAIYAVYVDVLRRATGTGALPHDLAPAPAPRDPLGHAPVTTPIDVGVTPVTSDGSDDGNDLTLKLLLTRRRTDDCSSYYCPCSACYWCCMHRRLYFPFWTYYAPCACVYVCGVYV